MGACLVIFQLAGFPERIVAHKNRVEATIDRPLSHAPIVKLLEHPLDFLVAVADLHWGKHPLLWVDQDRTHTQYPPMKHIGG
jgi:hypothetical protein